MQTLAGRLIRCVSLTKRGCWNWQGSCNRDGYGQLSLEGKRGSLAHRASYQAFVGPIGRLCVLHSCDNPSCINPKHLFLGTNQDNVDDKVCKNRQARVRGERNGRAKLTQEDVRYILSSNKSLRRLSSELGVSHATIGKIRRGELWSYS